MSYKLALELVVLQYLTRTSKSDWVCDIGQLKMVIMLCHLKGVSESLTLKCTVNIFCNCNCK
jgi:hypothetical protein